MSVSSKRQLCERWNVEPGRTIGEQIRQMLLDYSAALRPLEWKAHETTGLFLIPPEWLPPFDTQVIFDLLSGLPYCGEVANGRDFRGIPSIGGNSNWDLTNCDFSFLPGTEGYSFSECRLDGSKFDGSKGEFSFSRNPLRKVRFRNVRFVGGSFSVTFSGDCLECDFSGASMRSAQFLTRESLQGSCLAGANLEWANFTGCDLRGCNFCGANLSNAYIQEALIDRSTDFRGANLLGLHWQDRRDNSGNLFKRASDWRQGTFDSFTLHD